VCVHSMCCNNAYRQCTCPPARLSWLFMMLSVIVCACHLADRKERAPDDEPGLVRKGKWLVTARVCVQTRCVCVSRP